MKCCSRLKRSIKEWPEQVVLRRHRDSQSLSSDAATPNKKGTDDDRQCLFSASKVFQRDNIKVSYSRSSSAVDNRCNPSNTQTSNDRVKP